MTVLVDTEGGIVAALYLGLSGDVVVRNIELDFFWEPSCFLVAQAELTEDVETPCVKVACFRDAGGVTETS